MQQITVPPRLLAHPFRGVDQQQRGIGLRRAGHHVAQKFLMPRRVDQHIVALIGLEPDVRGINGHALVALALQRIGQKRPLERHAAAGAHFLDRFQAAFRQASGIVEQASDQGGFAVVDMADDDDRQAFSILARHRGAHI